MSKEKSAAWRSMRKTSAEDAQTMREMHANRTPDPVMDNADMEGTGYRWRNAPATEPRAEEDTALAMHTLWRSDRRINLNGKWYVPLSEVADILMTGDCYYTEEPLSEEWQAKCFPNLNIGSGMGEPINAGNTKNTNRKE